MLSSHLLYRVDIIKRDIVGAAPGLDIEPGYTPQPD